MEQPFGRGHCEERLALASTPRLPEDHYRVRVAAGVRDIRALPFERVDDVQHSDIAGGSKIRAEVTEVCETKNVQAMVDGDHHHVSAERQIGSVVTGGGSGPGAKSAAMQPEHHRPLAAVVECWCPNVQHEAVLALTRRTASGHR